MTHLNLIETVVRNTCAAYNALVRQHPAGQYVWYVRSRLKLFGAIKLCSVNYSAMLFIILFYSLSPPIVCIRIYFIYFN